MDAKLLEQPHENNHRMVPLTTQGITIAKLKALLPKKTNVAVTEEILRVIHSMEEDTGLPQELLEEDLMSYMHLIGNARGSGLHDLVKAIKFCNLKRNYTNREAWAIVFPEKYDRLVAANKTVDNHVSMYNKSKLVIAIDTEMLMPVSLQYSGHFHSAVQELYKIGVLGEGGLDAKGNKMTVTPMVKVQALKELVATTKPLEEQKLSITTTPSDEALSMQQTMNEQVAQLVAIQKAKMSEGADILDAQITGINFNELGGSIE